MLLFSWRYNLSWLYFHSTAAGFSLLVFEVLRSHMTRQSVGLHWTSDQSVTEHRYIYYMRCIIVLTQRELCTL